MSLPGNPVGTYTLPIQLSDAEKAQKKAEFFLLDLEVERANEDLAMAKLIHKDLTTIPKRDMNKLRKELRQGFVEEEVRAVKIANEDDGIWEYYKEGEDTGVPYHTEKMTRAERKQLEIKYGKVD